MSNQFITARYEAEKLAAAANAAYWLHVSGSDWFEGREDEMHECLHKLAALLRYELTPIREPVAA